MEATAPAETPPRGDSALARLVGVFFSPGKTFEAIARRPNWLAPVLVWMAASLLVTAVLLPKIDYEKIIRQAMEKRGQTVPEERLASIAETQQKVGTVIGWVSGAVVPLLVSLVTAVALWGAFKAFGWETTYKQALGVTAHAYLPGVLGALLLVPIVARQDRVDPSGIGDLLRSNLGFLVSRDNKALHSLLASVDLFSFWTLALLTIGFAASARIRKGPAAALILSLWAVYVLGKAGVSAIF